MVRSLSCEHQKSHFCLICTGNWFFKSYWKVCGISRKSKESSPFNHNKARPKSMCQTTLATWLELASRKSAAVAPGTFHTSTPYSALGLLESSLPSLASFFTLTGKYASEPSARWGRNSPIRGRARTHEDTQYPLQTQLDYSCLFNSWHWPASNEKFSTLHSWGRNPQW